MSLDQANAAIETLHAAAAADANAKHIAKGAAPIDAGDGRSADDGRRGVLMA